MAWYNAIFNAVGNNNAYINPAASVTSTATFGSFDVMRDPNATE